MAGSRDGAQGIPRKRPNFAALPAQAESSKFGPEERSQIESLDQARSRRSGFGSSEHPYSPITSTSPPLNHYGGLRRELFGSLFGRRNNGRSTGVETDREGQHDPSVVYVRRTSFATQIPRSIEFDKKDVGGMKRGGQYVSEKLGTFSGVFVPTSLNVLSILMFLRFGFILGQSGFLGMMAMLIASYSINLVTTMSISAIATNGTVRGGGAYYLISRSLGPEFGGSIGIVFYLGFVFNTGMNAVGLIDCLTQSFGCLSGNWTRFLPEGFWWQYLWGSIVLIMCTTICLAGSSMFSRASTGLLAILLVATFSIPLSAMVMGPFKNASLGIEFTGLSLQTFLDNLKPRLTKGAAGSQLPGKENFQDLFGILFPATGGIFAGASMSGDLKNPSKSIPRGTLLGLGLTFFTYTAVILSMAFTITRASFYNDVNIIQNTNISGVLILLGEFATSFFSSLMGVIGSAKLLQAVARDTLIPGLSIFGQGSAKTDEPRNAIIFTFAVAQFTMLFDINRIASFITMTYLMTFLVTNLACFLLKVGSAPNFRPSFHYFNAWTALAGTIISGVTMFFVDGIYATGSVCVLIVLFLLIHYTSPPKAWGDVSQSLIYHQVRKYLLRLRPEHVKFWRPQILLFVNDFDTQYKMIHFCNSLKKGALFVLGNVMVTDDFAAAVPKVRREQAAWTKFIEFSKVKAFVNISVAPTAEWGIRNIVLNAGLGGMRPNIVVIDQFREDNAITSVPTGIRSRRGSRASKPSFGDDGARRTGGGPSSPDSTMTVESYLTILEDLLFKLRVNVAVAKGFEDLELPSPGGTNTKKYIDLWPIQMSAEIAADGSTSKQNLLTTNFDTYTLILQLGCILHTVPSWKKSYCLRVAVFVEYESDVEEERGRVETLLEKLRIEAEVLVFWLASGNIKSYRLIVNGDASGVSPDVVNSVNLVLKDEEWWQDMQKFRDGYQGAQAKGKLGHVARLLGTAPAWPSSSFQHGRPSERRRRFEGLRKMMQNSKRRSSVGGMGISLGMQSHRLLDSMVHYHSEGSEESSDESDFEPYDSDINDEDTEVNGSRIQTGQAPEAGTRTGRSKSLAEPSTPRKRRGGRIMHPKPQKGAASETAIVDDSEESDQGTSAAGPLCPAITTTKADEPSRTGSPHGRAILPRSASSHKFSSSPIPETQIAADEGTGPSIMFAESSMDPPTARESIYARQRASDDSTDSGSEPGPASGYPSQASVPLSFNDLPCRAQHMVLNEMIRKHSQNTAVVFTTLPSPVEGTWRDKSASEMYVSDLDVLCEGLPPCLLVHSNSMTVTMNL
ncbi:hypothetical protein AJ80_04579 [Polytolypa hystricis UAMH7299]|uniref:Amino acid permease/ SLC12A domain-containing protein n=1 Tax=Polytolypa hystricis (strain UAMH7299) TaxID=1447883 RepID=A0A2B7YBE2_POLH7|nr:hypothetical protein AJ80_04579 [Polytolypa hystricis UAMH7299]